MIPTSDGIYTTVPEDVYHQDRGSLSVSGAKLLLPPSCPAKFREYQDNPPKPKREYDFGHLAHLLVLGKGAQVRVIDAPDYRTKAAREARDDAHDKGEIPALAAEFTRADDMAAVVLNDDTAGPLFADGTPEVSLYSTDRQTGVRLRGRCDWITGGGDIVDYKTSTTANPAELERKFYTLGYYMQAAWYQDLAIVAGASVDPQFVFVVQEKTPPYVVTVVDYDDEAMIEARRLNRLAIDTYAQCMAASEWPAYALAKVTISLPRFALRDGNQAAADNLIAELEGIYQA